MCCQDITPRVGDQSSSYSAKRESSSTDLAQQSTGTRISFQDHVTFIEDRRDVSMPISGKITKKLACHYKIVSLCLIIIGYMLLLRYSPKRVLDKMGESLPFEGGI